MMFEDNTLLADCAAAVLARHEPKRWRHAVDERWHYVLPADHQRRDQGWKLHVPATPLSACLVLSRAVEVLARNRCAFKFAATLRHLHELVGPNADRNAAGKFITVYPDDDTHARVVAEQLHEATLGLPGQWILTDRRFRPHSQVFYRYGGFTPPLVLTDDGEYRAVLRTPDGTVIPDQRGVGRVAPAWAVDPFLDPDAQPSTVAPSVLVGGRFTVRTAIRQNNRGGVYLAEDQAGSRVVLKRFREHTGATVDGGDSRTRARAEARMLSLLGPQGASPRFIDIFTSGTDIFVAQQWVDGVPLRRFVARELRPSATALALDVDLAVDLTGQLLDLLAKVHAAGYVLGDLTPNNVLVTPERRLVLIDLESALRPDDIAPRLLTPGYAAPEEEGRARMIVAAPDRATDLYGLGATLFHLASGAHPPAAKGTRVREMVRSMAPRNPVVARLAPAITGLLSPDPAQRPDIEDVRAMLTAPVTAAEPPAQPDIAELIDGMLADVVATADPAGASLWRNSETASRYDPCSVHVGAPGVMLVLCQAVRAGYTGLLDTIDTAARWTMRTLPREPRILPGLMFGRAGTAVSLYEAGVVLGAEDVTAAGLDLALTLPTQWHVPDVFHGVAGAGLALVRLWRHTGDDDLLVRARQCADGLLASATEGPQWTATGSFLLAGTRHWGFAHGVAGIAAFLLDVGEATGDDRYLDMARAAAEALGRVAIIDGDAAFWPSGEDDEHADTVRLTGFCSGATGVGTFLLRLHQLTGDHAALDLADRAATAVHHANWTSPPLWCHGLATDGDFLLDCADLSPTYRDHAADTARAITARAVRRRSHLLTPDDTGDVVASFANGYVGTLSFLLRLHHGGPRPLLPTYARDVVPA
ncbi:tRNA A-37 threonylcarbamoyl transferase component Bud32 [Actinokineospora baliensis]|uniref:class IV lanthionine synthetase LanL n=1 Tax=Actinokineospora baliensis TaxID=547056 RepID=UPI001957C76C|nr:class IV lanthionine synthetase LanL [Actinokineospora baliensis]MBM7775951.1 tRNA A-37 threonylcarbamoyl transferase component Bud32 [Actinokineospora baliensis]